MVHPSTVYVNAVQPIELRPRKGGRSFLEIVNMDAAAIYVSEDIQATAENGTQLGAAGTQFATRRWTRHSDGIDGVPQGSIWLIGSTAAPAQQRVLIREG